MHRKIVGILHLVMGAFTLVPVLGLMLLFGGLGAVIAHATDGHPGATFLGIGLATLLFVLVASAAFSGLLSVVAGAGVLLGRKWGDVVATAISVIYLFYFPFGTALAAYTVYGLWFAEPAPLRAYPEAEAASVR